MANLSKIILLSLSISMFFLSACGVGKFNVESPIEVKELTEAEADALDKDILKATEENSGLSRAENESQFDVMALLGNQCKYAVSVPDSVTRGTVLLTFDDGPNKIQTPLILDVLKQYNIKAVFFVLGSKVKGREDILKRIVDEGHTVANHSFNHPNFWNLDATSSYQQILTTDNLLAPYMGDLKIFRYPYGNSNCDANDQLEEFGYHKLGWDIDTCDWAYSDGSLSTKEMKNCGAKESERTDFLAYVKRQVKKTQGGVMLFHDIHENTAKKLEGVIEMLIKEGYRFSEAGDKNIFPKMNQR